MRTPTSIPRALLASMFVQVLVAAASGCAPSTYPMEAQSPSSSGYNASIGSAMSSGSSSSSIGDTSFSTPNRGSQRGELVVRPDTITIVFAFKKTNPDPQKALAALQERAAGVLARMQEATSGAATMKMCGASVRPTSSISKSSESDASYEVVVDGSIDVTLAPEQDYWARSRLIASITRAMRDILATLKDEPPGSAIHFAEPQITLKDPDALRAKLVERWVKRARELADAAQSPAAPLYLVDCAPPAPIEVRPISLEEVGLSLAVTCRVDSPRAPAPPK